MDLPYTVLPYSTLNQKLNIQAAATLNSGEIPKLKYAMVGIGGLSVGTGADGFTYTTSYNHKPTDTGLFQELPFIVRPISSDISSTIQENYRLRKLITVGSVNYFAYYGKILDLSTIAMALQNRDVASDGSVSISDFTPGSSNLSPTPTLLSSGTTVTTNGNYISATGSLPFILDANDVLELLNASSLIYGDENHAVISEIALCSGVDRVVTVTSGGISTTYTESIATQVMSYLSTNFPSADWSQGIRYTFDVGNSEPLLTVQV